MTTGFDNFNKWMVGISEKVKGDITHSSVDAAAAIIQEEAKLRAPVSKEAHYFNIDGRKYGPYQPGNLRDSIYRVFSKSRSAPNVGLHVYHVSWNFKKAPYGFMVEFGTSNSSAQAFLGPAFEAKKREAYAAAARVVRAGVK